MASPERTAAAAPPPRARMESPSAAHTGGLRGRFARVAWIEPWWLRGVTWPLVGMVTAIAAMQNLPQVLRMILAKQDGSGPSWQFAFFDLAAQLIAGLAIMLTASFLLNLRRPRVPAAVALSAAVVLGTLLPFNLISYAVDGSENLLFATAIARRVALPWAIAAAAWYFLQRANVRLAALRETDVARRRLETGVVEARLQALQAQVEPHFLFNTLAHVRRLYRTNPAQARRMLDSFRAYLQSALPRMRGMAVTLGDELDLVRAYLDVQQVRMGRRLTVHIDAATGLRACEFPSMMLICLVENAIKHGLNPLARGGEIHITAVERDATMDVCVADTGHGIGDTMGSGTGLANVRGRLAALYGSSARLTLAANVPAGVRAMLTLPLRPALSDAKAEGAIAVAGT
jgi:signal transduction histidine kinase